MTTMDDLQSRLGQWADTQFPNRTAHSIVAHMRREVEELAEARTPARMEEEAADVAMLLFDLAYFGDFSLFDAIAVKFAIVQNRRWQPPDASGVTEHIREEEP